MSVITRLVQGVKNPNRVNLYLDEKFAFSLSIDEVARHNLKKGLTLTDLQITSLQEVDQNAYIYAKILNFLSYRPRSVKEVRDRLWKYEVKDPSSQDLIIDRLKSNGYLDDKKFAEWFIESRNTHRPRSRRMLSQELMIKGVDKETISLVIGEIIDEKDTIVHLLDKKFGTNRKLEVTERQKIYSYLGRQGFAWEVILEVVKSWESE